VIITMSRARSRTLIMFQLLLGKILKDFKLDPNLI